ncbi:helix-turn-helix domain-containing protein [Candidatus Pacearchaeota archaeon]|nr:helix-turn-helix domain-containing protein [Candidatus Pacearchaeota archaeon]
MITNKEKIVVNKKAMEILKSIHNSEGSMTANKISEKTGIAYVTVQKYLKALKETKLVVQKEKGAKKKKGQKSKSIHYSLNYNYLHSKEI